MPPSTRLNRTSKIEHQIINQADEQRYDAEYKVDKAKTEAADLAAKAKEIKGKRPLDHTQIT